MDMQTMTSDPDHQRVGRGNLRDDRIFAHAGIHECSHGIERVFSGAMSVFPACGVLISSIGDQVEFIACPYFLEIGRAFLKGLQILLEMIFPSRTQTLREEIVTQFLGLRIIRLDLRHLRVRLLKAVLARREIASLVRLQSISGCREALTSITPRPIFIGMNGIKMRIASVTLRGGFKTLC